MNTYNVLITLEIQAEIPEEAEDIAANIIGDVHYGYNGRVTGGEQYAVFAPGECLDTWTVATPPRSGQSAV